MSEILELRSETFSETVLHSDRPVLVEFVAPWCGPCRSMEPNLKRLADDYGENLVVGKLDIDEYPELAAEFEIVSIPTLVILQGGKSVHRFDGVQPAERIAAVIDGLPPPS